MPRQQNIASDDAITAIRFPIRLITVACLLTIMAFAGFGWIIFDARRDLKQVTGQSRVEELRGVVVHLDEELTMSARMAAATGDSQWEERYIHFESQLDAAIKEATKTETNLSNIKSATRRDAPNIKLVEMENRAFALVRAGRKEEAQAVLFSPEYEAQKQIYAGGTALFTSQVRREFDDQWRDDQFIDWLSLIGAVAVCGISLVAWISAARGMRGWRGQLLDSFQQRAEAEENLRKAHADLEVRVNERTAELANANEALQAEITERKSTEEQLRVQTTALDAAANAVMITDHNGTIQSVNPAFTALTGYTAQEAVGQNPRVLKSGNHDEAFYRNLWQTIFSGRVWRGELTNRRKDGSLYTVEQTIAPVAGKGGRITHYIAIMQDVTARRQAEQSLRLFRSLIEQSNDAIEVIDPETGRFLDANEKASTDLGYTREEFLSLKVPDIDPVFDQSAFSKAVEELRKSGAATAESLHRRKNGSTFPVEINLKYVQLDRDYMVTVVRDITARKQTEDALRASEERYRALFESNPNPMWVYDVETLSFLAVNATAVGHYGYSQDEFLAMTIKDIRPDEDIAALMDDLSKRTGDMKDSTQWRHCRKDRTMIYVEIASQDLIWLGRRARLVLINDITERKRTEQKLLEQANLLNLSQDAIMVRGMDDRIEFWNRGAEHLYGWSAEEVRDLPISDFLDYEEPVKILAERSLLETGAWSGECHHRTKQGDTVIVRSRWTLVRDEHGQPKAKLVIMTDMTEQKKAEEQFLRAQRLESIGTLASGVAHDLNNILAPILICADVIKRNPTREDLPAMVSMIEESAKRGANVVKQVLTFARGIEGERVLINPSHLVQEMVDIARTTFPKSIEIMSRYPEDLWSINCDPTQLHQVLLNLSVNARDAMPNGGSIIIGAENFVVDEHYASMTPDAKPGPHVMFRVTDNGSGMSRATIDKIFDPFFTTKEVGKGTGLGLSTVLGIVKSHGGFMSVRSEAGKGATFKIFLPAEVSDQSLLSSETRGAPAKGNGELVLVVDDEENILRATRTVLEQHNYRVISASDGVEALALFAQRMQAISVVLTDIAMPYMDGVASVRALRKMKPDVPIIAFTGEAQEARLKELQALNVNNFLIKPCSTEDLLAAVHATVGTNEVDVK